MKNPLLLLGALLSAFTFHSAQATPSSQSDSNNLHAGKQLMDQARCMRCHSVMSFHAGYTKMESLGNLKKQVKLCDSNLKVGWFDDEVDTVVDYLNQTYYHFK